MKLNGQAVAARRKLLGLTQVELSARVQVSEQAVVAWERGHVSLPRPDRLSALAEALDCNTRDLVELDDAEAVA